MLRPVLTTLTLDPSEGERCGDVVIGLRFPAASFYGFKAEVCAEACADRARAMALAWFRDNGPRPGETRDEFLHRIRRGAVHDAQLTMEADPFASVQEVS